MLLENFFLDIFRILLYNTNSCAREINREAGGSLTQPVEYLPFKQRVVGSNPARPTKTAKLKKVKLIILKLAN